MVRIGLSTRKDDLQNPIGLICVLISMFLLAFISGSIFFSVGNSSAESKSVDIVAKINSVLAIATNATNNELLIDIMPTPSGTLVKNQLTVMVSTNNSTGYTLNMNSVSTNTDLIHQSAIGSTPSIPSTANPYLSPAALSADTWGWNLGAAASTTTFKKIPPSDDSQTIRTTDAPSNTPSPDSDTPVTFAVNATSNTASGAYINTIVFTATTNYIPLVTPCQTGDYECILFTINTTDGTYSIPTSGYVASMNHTYDWDVYVDGVLTTDCPGGNCIGTSHNTTAPGVNGITLTGLSSGQHQIKIVPHAAPTPGWGNAFGHTINTTGANAQANKNKLISLDSPLTTMAFAPKTTESTTNAYNMFGSIFLGCTNLTTPATFMDTYKLPNTITDLSYFLSRAHEDNNLIAPIDFTPLTDWLNTNTSITNLAYFLYGSHRGNTGLATPIDLTSLAGWFNANTSITNLSYFLGYVHAGNTGLSTLIDLTPLAGWFNTNTSITNLSGFLNSSHEYNNLTTPIDLTPLTGWFNANTSITNLSQFLSSTHRSNNLATPIDLTPVANWFNTNTSITNLSFFLNSIHYDSTNLTTPIDLTPVANWFNTNTSITNLSSFLAGIHNGNKLSIPINLTPLAGWFNANTSITNLDNFLDYSHQNNTNLTTPINLTPLTNWFNTNTSITNLSNFLSSSHGYNNLTTPIDLTPLNNWFNTNTSITSLNGFLSNIHRSSTNLTVPTNLAPLAGWFNANNSITSLYNFLYSIHERNNLATPIDLTPLGSWFNGNTSITNLSSFLNQAHFVNANIITPIDLTPLTNWFDTNNSITNLASFLNSIHRNNTNLNIPINLTPIAGWFNANTSITNLSNFLQYSHQSNTNLTTPINLTPLTNWFSSGRSFVNLSSFLDHTHHTNSSLTLSGQTIFPNWIKTATEGGTPIWNVADTFAQTFNPSSTKAGDTGEPKFQDGSVLSSLGTPNVNRQTYTNRSGITPVNSNWK